MASSASLCCCSPARNRSTPPPAHRFCPAGHPAPPAACFVEAAACRPGLGHSCRRRLQLLRRRGRAGREGGGLCLALVHGAGAACAIAAGGRELSGADAAAVSPAVLVLAAVSQVAGPLTQRQCPIPHFIAPLRLRPLRQLRQLRCRCQARRRCRRRAAPFAPSSASALPPTACCARGTSAACAARTQRTAHALGLAPGNENVRLESSEEGPEQEALRREP